MSKPDSADEIAALLKKALVIGQQMPFPINVEGKPSDMITVYQYLKTTKQLIQAMANAIGWNEAPEITNDAPKLNGAKRLIV